MEDNRLQFAGNQTTESEMTGSRWNLLYKIGGTAALIIVAFIPLQMVLFIVWPPPGFQATSSNVIGWFTLFRHHKLIGLLQMDLLLVVDQVLAVPMVLALYVALRRASESIMALATALSFVGIAAYLASNTAFQMLSLSGQYGVAATDAERSLLVAAGQATLAIYTGTAFQVNYVLGSVVVAMTAVVMLRGHLFSKATAYAGILGSVIGLGLYVPKIGLVLALISVPFLAVWNILVARRLFQLGQGGKR